MTVNYKSTIGTATGGDWYNTLVLSDICNDDGTTIEVKDFICLYFVAPVAVDDIPGHVLVSSSDPWIDFSTEVKNKKIDNNSFSVLVTIKKKSGQPFSFSKKNIITLPFNAPTADSAHLSETLKDCLSKIIITADKTPTTEGGVEIHCAVSPDISLEKLKPALKFSYGEVVVTTELDMGKTKTLSLLAGHYTAEAEGLENEDVTVATSVLINPSSTEVIAGQSAEMDITFGEVSYFSAIDFEIEKMDEIASEKMKVSLSTSDQRYDFDIVAGQTKEIRHVAPTGDMSTVVAPMRFNNRDISFKVPSLKLEGKRVKHVITRSITNITEVNAESFKKIALNINTEFEGGKSITVRLLSDEMIYVQRLELKNQTALFPILVMPGSYKVIIENFIHNKVVYVVDIPDQLIVKETGDNNLNVVIKRSANLAVRGFPGFLSFGGSTTFENNNKQLFINARTSSIFKYAGPGGDGNPTEFLENDLATVNTINLARAIESALPEDGNVLPVMISYTVQVSGGDTSVLSNREYHMHSYGNFILALTIAQNKQDAQHPVPAGFIVNPDFLGECQKGKIRAETPMPVRSPLTDALKHWGLAHPIPITIQENVGGYIQSVNWLVRTIAPSVTFGWQINLWGVGSSLWIYDNAGALTPRQAAKETTDYLKSMKVYDGEYCPDFLAIDRYEADDLNLRAYINSYCYGPHEWGRFYDFCAEVSAQLAFPVMPWQIPASRTPLQDDNVTVNFEEQHWGTSANYLLGDAALGSEVKNIHPTIRAFDFTKKAPSTAAMVGATPEVMYTRKGKFDLSVPAYEDFAKRGIFAVLLGGGSTLGIVPSLGCSTSDTTWAGKKLSEYRDHPVTFNDTLK